MIRLDEFVYEVNGTLPVTTYENDISDTILGIKKFNSVTQGINYFYDNESYVTGYTLSSTGYTLSTITGTTTLTRDEYPVYENNGLPKGRNSKDGSIFFASGKYHASG